MQEIINKLKFNEAGLIPAVAQDVKSKEVLMLAWMNLESINATISSGYATYYSRSRQKATLLGIYKKLLTSPPIVILIVFC